MTVNYYIQCPVCETVTRMRSPAGYIYRTPVRIHCGHCNTLLTGEFISDNANIKAYYVPKNCKRVPPQSYEYYGEASGEILCKKIERLPGQAKDLSFPPNLSPIFSFFNAMNEENRRSFINYACYMEKLTERWDSEQIKYTLFLNGKLELLKSTCGTQAEQVGYPLSSDFEVMRYIYRSFFFDCGGIFSYKTLRTTLTEINRHFRHLNFDALKDYIHFLEEKGRIATVQSKLFGILFSYVSIAQNLIPAVCAARYEDPSAIDRTTFGLTTCSFDDIKNFYQDTYESLTDCCDLVVGLDNLEVRGHFNTFSNRFDMEKFRAQSKGNRLKHLDKGEFFANVFHLPSESGELRNAIGHNDFRYQGIRQSIEYTVLTTGEAKTAYLLDVALECVALMKSAYILLFYLYELQRYRHRVGRESIVMNSFLYANTSSQSRCPCGSGKKYRKCCQAAVESEIKAPSYPNRSSM